MKLAINKIQVLLLFVLIIIIEIIRLTLEIKYKN